MASARRSTSAGSTSGRSGERSLLHSIVNDHVLVDGAQRLGWLAIAVFLDINGTPITTTANDDVYRLVMDVAAGDPPLDETAHRLRLL